MKPRTYRRLKSRYPTARAAWQHIKKRFKGDYRGIKSAHTRQYWVFHVV